MRNYIRHEKARQTDWTVDAKPSEDHDNLWLCTADHPEHGSITISAISPTNPSEILKNLVWWERLFFDTTRGKRENVKVIAFMDRAIDCRSGRPEMMMAGGAA